MTSEDVEQVIQDRSELWVEKPEKPKDKGKGKEMKAASQTRKDPEKKKEQKESEGNEEKTVPEKDMEQTDKRKESIGEK